MRRDGFVPLTVTDLERVAPMTHNLGPLTSHAIDEMAAGDEVLARDLTEYAARVGDKLDDELLADRIYAGASVEL